MRGQGPPSSLPPEGVLPGPGTAPAAASAAGKAGEAGPEPVARSRWAGPSCGTGRSCAGGAPCQPRARPGGTGPFPSLRASFPARLGVRRPAPLGLSSRGRKTKQSLRHKRFSSLSAVRNCWHIENFFPKDSIAGGMAPIGARETDSKADARITSSLSLVTEIFENINIWSLFHTQRRFSLSSGS